MALTLVEPITVNTSASFTFANVTAGNLLTNNIRYANGSPYVFTTNAAGSNTQVQFNDSNLFAGSANFTFNKTTNTLTVSNITANGAGLTNIPGANVTGTVPNATAAITAGTVTTGAQPNITSVGTLTSLAVTGNISAGNANLGNLVSANFFSGSGNLLSNIQGSNVTGAVASATTAGTVTTNAQPNITSVGTLTGLTSTGTINLTNASNVSLGPVGNVKITGGTNGQYLTTDGSGNLSFTSISISSASISNGNSNVNIPSANGNVNISAVGNANVLVVTGAGVNISGTLNAAGNANVGNLGATGVIASTLTSNVATGTAPLTVTSTTRVANLNVAQANVAEFLTITTQTSGNAFLLLANAVTGNVSETANSVFVANSSNGAIHATTFVGALSGAATSATTAGTVTTNAQPNITSVGTLTSLAVTGNITAGNANLGNLAIANFFSGSGNLLSNIQGGNVTGAVASATTAGTVTTNAQPNITSVGTLAGLTSTGTINLTGASNVSLGAIGNVKVTGGSSGQYLTTDGAGNLSFATVNTTLLSNGNSNVNIPAANGNVNISAIGNANVVVITGTGVNVAGTGNFTGNLTSGNLNTTGIVASTLTSNVATGTAPLTVTSTTRVANLNVAQANIAEFLIITTQTTGNAFILLANAVTGNVSETANSVFVANSSNGAIHATTFVGALSGAATTAGTVTTAAQPNITSVGTLTSLTLAANGNITMSGSVSQISGANLVSATLLTGTLTTAAQPNITSVGTLTSASITGNITAGNVYANSGTVGASLVTGTLTTAAQPNITSLGTLTALNLSGVATFYASQDRFSTLTGATGVVTHDLNNGATFYHTSAAANFTANFTNVPTTNNYTTIATIFVVQGATPYLPTAVQIAGVAQTIRWLGGAAPTGTANQISLVSFALVRNAGAWTVLGQGSNYN